MQHLTVLCKKRFPALKVDSAGPHVHRVYLREDVRASLTSCSHMATARSLCILTCTHLSLTHRVTAGPLQRLQASEDADKASCCNFKPRSLDSSQLPPPTHPVRSQCAVPICCIPPCSASTGNVSVSCEDPSWGNIRHMAQRNTQCRSVCEECKAKPPAHCMLRIAAVHVFYCLARCYARFFVPTTPDHRSLWVTFQQR